MADKIRIKRTEGTDPPSGLEFGELAFADGADTVFVGKADGSALPIGSSTPPSLADVAYSGSYDDLTDQPIIPTIPTLADVAYSGSYDDLTDKPDISVSVNDLIPNNNTEVLTNRYFHDGTGYKKVYRYKFIWTSPYPNNSFLGRAHGIANIDKIVDYALYYSNGESLYKVTYNEAASGRTEAAIFNKTYAYWNSAKDKGSDGTITVSPWFIAEYTKMTDSYVIL